MKRARGDIKRGNAHDTLQTSIHLSAPTTRVEKFGARKECTPNHALEIALDDHPTIDTSNQFINNSRRAFLLIPVRVPILRIDKALIELRAGSLEEELLGSPKIGQGKFEHITCTPESGTDRHLGMSVSP